MKSIRAIPLLLIYFIFFVSFAGTGHSCNETCTNQVYSHEALPENFPSGGCGEKESVTSLFAEHRLENSSVQLRKAGITIGKLVKPGNSFQNPGKGSAHFHRPFCYASSRLHILHCAFLI